MLRKISDTATQSEIVGGKSAQFSNEDRYMLLHREWAAKD